MAEKLTPQQEMAVLNRGGKLLVSAAAGSGKTKVLVDRLMSYIQDPMDPADLDQFLMITYTKAAAAELRGKIAAKLTEKMAADPENRHLQRQMQRLYLTKISTVHAFCGDILREYAYLLDIPGDFRVADENECAQLRQDVMQRLLDTAYEQAQEDGDFRSFVDAQGLGRDDRLVPDILLKVYDSARCHLDPQGWLDLCVANGEPGELTDVSETLWGRYLMDSLFSWLDLQLKAMTLCAEKAHLAEGMEKAAVLLDSTVEKLKFLRSSRTWDEVVERKKVDFGRMTIPKSCPDQELGDRIKAIRTACKEGLERRTKSFADPSSQIFADMQGIGASIRGMVALVRRFDREFDRAKRARRILDFGDLEHRMLDLLLGKSRSGPTAAAAEIGGRFREIMVDEYQDSNEVQDSIFTALTQKRQNCFMVGDVKQSIYQFRLADPKIFLKKYHDYAFAEDARQGEGRKVFLSSNFRSGGDVLKSVNDVFRLCMSEEVGGLVYGDSEALNEGIPHIPLGEPEVELYAIEVDEDGVYQDEPAVVARRIRELLDGTHFVRDGGALRPIRPEDIAILLRSPGSVGAYFQQALEEQGIRCVTGGGDDLLAAQEICTLRSILQTVSNPRQDIPLVAALTSPVFGFTADDLAVFRSADRKSCIYEALLKWDTPKARYFLDTLDILRREARMGTIAQLIEKIFTLTRMDSIYGAMDYGAVKMDNLQTFYGLAVDFETTARRDLEQFLEHLDALEDKGLIVSGDQSAPGAVTMMSIHKSKGLEFPVVFVSGLSREFNREGSRAQVLCDQELGLGLSVVDAESRIRYPSVAKRAIAAKMISDSLSEEMRVLYVALTRARDRLIMTYASQNLQKDLTDMALRMDMSDMRLLTGGVSSPGEWVLMTALRRTEAGELFALGAKPLKTAPGDPVWKIRVVHGEKSGDSSACEEKTRPDLEPGTVQRLREALQFRYAHGAATIAPSKQTATQRKGRDKDAEAAEDAPEEHSFTRSWRQPGESKPGGTDMGNAVHAVMQFVDFKACTDEAAVGQQIRRIREQGLISEQQTRLVNPKWIWSFFNTALGRKLRDSDEVLREFKFSILEDGAHFSPELTGEKILLQGVVDCALIEDDGITVLDFKTDFVTEDTVSQRAESYRPQVLAYADAMARIYEKPVKSAMLYFFRLGKFVSVLAR